MVAKMSILKNSTSQERVKCSTLNAVPLNFLKVSPVENRYIDEHVIYRHVLGTK